MAPRPKQSKPAKVPKLPQLLERKIYKTGQTRGADDDEIFQNRVGRNSTVLIPYAWFDKCRGLCGTGAFENGFIVLLSPAEYFGTAHMDKVLASKNLAVGTNALVFYESRSDWNTHSPEKLKWTPATSRVAPLGGQYVARIPGTTSATGGDKIVRGFNATSLKGAGIRIYEYAPADAINDCCLQLEALYWHCRDSLESATSNGMQTADAATRRDFILGQCESKKLLDMKRLTDARIVNAKGRTTCPLCLEEISSHGFFKRMKQADGRVVLDLTITELNLFHIAELRIDALNHKPYNLGWGHHHCNVVVKDSGIMQTLEWMQSVLDRNVQNGHRPTGNKTGS